MIHYLVTHIELNFVNGVNRKNHLYVYKIITFGIRAIALVILTAGGVCLTEENP